MAWDYKDAKECADVSHKLLELDPNDSSSKELFFEISDAQADFYDDQAAKAVGKVDSLKMADVCLVEALNYLSDEDLPRRTRNLLPKQSVPVNKA